MSHLGSLEDQVITWGDHQGCSLGLSLHEWSHESQHRLQVKLFIQVPEDQPGRMETKPSPFQILVFKCR